MRGPAIGRSFAPFIGEDACDRGADPRRGRNLDAPAMQLDEGAHDGQPQAHAAMARPERMALEPLEDARLDLRRDAAALVLHVEDNLAAALARRDTDGLA